MFYLKVNQFGQVGFCDKELVNKGANDTMDFSAVIQQAFLSLLNTTILSYSTWIELLTCVAVLIFLSLYLFYEFIKLCFSIIPISKPVKSIDIIQNPSKKISNAT